MASTKHRKEMTNMTTGTENSLAVQEEDREMIRLLATLNQTKRAITKGFILGLKADSKLAPSMPGPERPGA